MPLAIEKPAAGGPMIARVDGQVVLVAGAIPGERVVARITRVGKGVAYADTISIEDPSGDRREPLTDPLCGGCLYAHIAYPRQLAIKGQVIADAFARISRLPLRVEPRVFASPEDGYRMRARLHLGAGQSRSGFFREGTHDPCDARATRQLLSATYDVLDRVSAGLRSLSREAVFEVEVSENIEATQRAVHVQGHIDAASPVDPRAFGALGQIEGLSGLVISGPSEVRLKSDATGKADTAGTPEITETIGDPCVTDVLSIEGRAVTLRRHVLAFFQGNRYLLQDLIAHVVGPIDRDSPVVDLYAGVGVFAVAAAVVRGAHVVAVEGDRVAARDLEHNARTAGGAIETVHLAVETFVRRWKPGPDTVGTLIVDPPRTGMSKEATEGAIRLAPRRITYVSCDVATLARDARRLVDAGYAIQDVTAFDLFPNTPHVETVVRFENVRM